jgi:DNA-binding TFAR19-related protein (PDSD5 family)
MDRIDNIPSEQQILAQQQQQAEMKERRDSILLQILDPSAKERLIKNI